jgi:branched-chain amino acid transport system substrate-binding protein
MSTAIGVLLPRSTDYPSLGFDIMDGLRCSLRRNGKEDIQCITESIGFGEDQAFNYARAEKLLLQDNVAAVIAYCNASNAEALYGLAGAAGKPFIFVDPGMQLPQLLADPFCYHISLQGIHACRVAGFMAGENKRKVLMATSFYDGGYRGPWGYVRGLEDAGGTVCGNYVSGYKEAEFSIEPYMALLQQSGAESVAACFSTYLADLFIKALKEKHPSAIALPFYCAPFMAEEQLLSKCDFPGGTFYTIVPWASGVEQQEQQALAGCISSEKHKKANIFHLLGWEAGIVAGQALEQGAHSLQGFVYASPRGMVTIHPQTHYTYAPLYKGEILAGGQGKCELHIRETVNVSAGAHEWVHYDRPERGSGWKNNYLCI